MEEECDGRRMKERKEKEREEEELRRRDGEGGFEKNINIYKKRANRNCLFVFSEAVRAAH